MSENKKIITVMGATGAQGGGLVRAILSNPASGFVARAVTRDITSEKARALADAGAEVVQADVDDPGTLRHAFEGAHGAFCVTFFWEHFSVEREQAHALALAQAVKQAGVSHVVWSTLEDTRQRVPLHDDRMPTLQGKYKVPHFDGKGEANRYFTEAGVPTTFLLTSFYWENFIHSGLGPRRGPDGRLALHLPVGDRRLPGIGAADIGGCALGIFERGAELVGQTVGIAAGHPTGAEMAAALGEALGETVTYTAVPFDAFRAFDFPGAEDLGNMFQYKHDFEPEYCAARDLAFSRGLHPAIQTLSEWCAANAGRIPLG